MVWPICEFDKPIQALMHRLVLTVNAILFLSHLMLMTILFLKVPPASFECHEITEQLKVNVVIFIIKYTNLN